MSSVVTDRGSGGADGFPDLGTKIAFELPNRSQHTELQTQKRIGYED